ncbi:MAG: serine/threonine-protein kinase [Vicinamibacterales bacterium]
MDARHRADWQTASPYLDTALDLPPEARATWLAGIRADRPELADLIAAWLAECDALEQHDFMGAAAPIEPARSSLAGVQLGSWRLVSPIGHGGMGTVWLAERTDGRFEGRAAVKLLNASLVGRSGGDRFAREGRILARLAHPQIAHLVDAGVSEIGQPYLVLEYVEGEPIDAHCDRLRLPVADRVRLLIDLMTPVAHAHAHLVVHRDLKPSNVLVTAEGRVKLLDFGIARLLDTGETPDGVSPLTREGDALLTPAYAAPEQVAGGQVSTATDVYALGVLAYVMLTGRHPAGAALDTPAALMRAIADDVPPRMSDALRDDDPAGSAATRANARAVTPGRLRQQLAGDLDTIVATALKKAPGERYASVEAFAADLRRHLASEPISARTDAMLYRASKFVRRNPWPVALGTAAILAIVAGAAGTWVQSRRAEAQRDFAMRQLARAESLNDLNGFLLSDAAPLGQSFTAGLLLARAEDLLNRHPADRVDANLVESLISVGVRPAAGRRRQRPARALARLRAVGALPAESAVTRARAACALGALLARGSDLPAGQRLAAEGLAAVPQDHAFTLDRVFCERQVATVAREAGDSTADVAHVLAAERLLRESGMASELATLSMTMEVAEAYRNAGRTVEAGQTFAAAYEQMKALGRDNTEQAGTLLNNWALTLIGQPREAERLYRQAVAISSADGGEASVSPMLLTNLAREVLELGRVDEALDLANRAAAEARRLDDQVVMQQNLALRIRAYREAGDLARAGLLLDEFAGTQQQRLPPGHVAFAAVASERSLWALARGDLRRARQEADRAVAIAEASTQNIAVLARALVRRADIAVAEGRPADAIADAARGLAIEEKDAPPRTSVSRVGRAYAALARACRAAGDRAKAASAAEEAVRHLTGSLGADHRETVAAREVLASLSR